MIFFEPSAQSGHGPVPAIHPAAHAFGVIFVGKRTADVHGAQLVRLLLP